MKNMTAEQFNQRWSVAVKGASAPEVKVCKPNLTLSLNTILDNFTAQLQQAVQGHAIEQQQYEAICQKVAELKPLIEDAQTSAQDFLQL
jgi:hypothetical protein